MTTTSKRRSRIQVLPERLVHQIAAGEIVERPASVLKELLENALDAESNEIRIWVEEGGKRLIRIRDNGIGMSREDAELAFRRHATSKISNLEDLRSVSTLGFRGEALPSIASICRLHLRTVDQGDQERSDTGSEVFYEGGELREIREISWPIGTEVLVEDLFYNIPARRKFLKSNATELKHLLRHFTHYALVNPAVSFTFQNGKKMLIEAPGVASLKERAEQVLGGDFIRSLVPVEYQKGEVFIEGFASLPHEQRRDVSRQYFFVNGRMVRDRVITHAVRMAYEHLIPAGAHPCLLLSLSLDPERVDVNVHPAKTEVRFPESNAIHRAVRHSLEAALNVFSETAQSARPFSSPQLDHSHNAGWSTVHDVLDLARPLPLSGAVRDSRVPYPEVGDRVEEGGRVLDDHVGPTIPETVHLAKDPVILGQLVESFIVAVDRDGVIVIDQHVAHERVLYETSLKQMSSSDSVALQRLLVPLTLEMTPSQMALMEPIMEHLNRNGFEVEPFGESTVVVKAVPKLARNCDYPSLIESIVEAAGEDDSKFKPEQWLERLRERVAISISCHGAIKINTPLAPQKMQWLLDALMACENPHTCPHGRPVFLRVSLNDILKGFKRA